MQRIASGKLHCFATGRERTERIPHGGGAELLSVTRTQAGLGIEMDAKRWQRVRMLFDSVADQPSERWLELLAAACPDEPAMVAEVLALLAADAEVAHRQTGLSEQVPDLIGDLGDEVERQMPDRWLDQRLGAWRLLQCIGRGGMGRVYLAERDDGEFRQQAALKLIDQGADHHEVVQRFRAERQILASLRHANIAGLMDGGVSSDGVPWFAMEYVDGAPITIWCDRQRASIEQRLRLFLSICAAVGHAHDRLVIHRDLKPGNILVADDGQVKLLDFGIAKLLDADGGDSAARTGTAMRLYTPEYAAPEQVRGDLPTTAVDIHALGLVLYELLTGCGPYRPASAGSAAMAQAVLTQEPQRPSSALLRDGEHTSNGRVDLSERAARRCLSPQRLRQRLRGDLDAIVLKALRKEPAQRYASVRDLAADVHAVLEHRPVAARLGNRRYHLLRFLRRNAIAVGASTAVVLALVSGLAAALWQAQQARVQRDLAQAEARKSEQVLEFMFGVFDGAGPGRNQDGDVTARSLLARASARIGGDLSEQPMVRAALLEAMARAYSGLGLPAEALPLTEQALQLRRQIGDRHALGRSLILHSTSLQNLARWPQVLPVLNEAEGLLDPAQAGTPLLRAEIDERIGLALLAEGAFDQAEPRFRSAWTVYSEHLPIEHERRVAAAMGLSRALAGQGQHDQAEALFVPIIEQLRQAGAEHAGTFLSALDTYGQLLFRQQRWPETEQVRAETLALAESYHGADAWRTLIASNNLGVARLRQQKYQQALGPLQRAVVGAEAILPKEHAFTMAARFNLAEAEAGLQQWPQALQRYRDIEDYLSRNPTVNQPDRGAVRTAIERCEQALTGVAATSSAEPP